MAPIKQVLSCEIQAMNEHIKEQMLRSQKILPILRDMVHASHSWERESEANHKTRKRCTDCLDCFLVEQKSLLDAFSRQVNYMHVVLDSLLEDIHGLYNFRLKPCKKQQRQNQFSSMASNQGEASLSKGAESFPHSVKKRPLEIIGLPHREPLQDAEVWNEDRVKKVKPPVMESGALGCSKTHDEKLHLFHVSP